MAEKRVRESRLRRDSSGKPRFHILICCEGKQTEPSYFNHIRQKLRISKDALKVQGLGYDPLSLVKCAARHKSKAERDKIPFEEVWCVLDCDNHPNIQEAFEEAERHKIKVIFSNPCFEIWYLFHFKKQTAFIERDKALKELKSFFTEYEKSMEKNTGIKFYELLQNHFLTACENVEEIRNEHKNNGKQETENPSTKADSLVKYLFGLRDGGNYDLLRR